MAQKKFVLTKENYFSKKRPHFSNSQLKDYMLDPFYFYQKHIKKDPDLATQVTDPMKRGSIVDEILTGGKMTYQRKVLKREDPKLFALQKTLDDKYLVTNNYWEQAIQIASHVQTHPVWQDGLKEAMFQVVLEGKINGLPVCGLADRIDKLTSGNYALRILDLKVVNPIKLDNPKKWLQNCDDMKYVHQLALYQRLAALKTGLSPESIQCAHVAGAYVDKGFTKVRAYILEQEYLDAAYKEIEDVCAKIAEKKFDPILTSWENAQSINRYQPSDFAKGNLGVTEPATYGKRDSRKH